MYKHKLLSPLFNGVSTTLPTQANNMPIVPTLVVLTPDVVKRTSNVLIFICHSKELCESLLIRYPFCYVLFVGSADSPSDDRCIVCRNLPINIEHEKKLLTFTAWYAICKNNLFPTSTHLCIFEYDVVIHNSFLTFLNSELPDEVDSYGAIWSNNFFKRDVSIPILLDFVNIRCPEPYIIPQNWFSTTNHCIKRQTLIEFVDWYYPACLLEIKHRHPKKFSWYHERLYFSFLQIKKKTVMSLPGVVHCYKNSHLEINP